MKKIVLFGLLLISTLEFSQKKVCKLCLVNMCHFTKENIKINKA